MDAATAPGGACYACGNAAAPPPPAPISCAAACAGCVNALDAYVSSCVGNIDALSFGTLQIYASSLAFSPTPGAGSCADLLNAAAVSLASSSCAAAFDYVVTYSQSAANVATFIDLAGTLASPYPCLQTAGGAVCPAQCQADVNLLVSVCRESDSVPWAGNGMPGFLNATGAPDGTFVSAPQAWAYFVNGMGAVPTNLVAGVASAQLLPLLLGAPPPLPPPSLLPSPSPSPPVLLSVPPVPPAPTPPSPPAGVSVTLSLAAIDASSSDPDGVFSAASVATAIAAATGADVSSITVVILDTPVACTLAFSGDAPLSDSALASLRAQIVASLPTAQRSAAVVVTFGTAVSSSAGGRRLLTITLPLVLTGLGGGGGGVAAGAAAAYALALPATAAALAAAAGAPSAIVSTPVVSATLSVVIASTSGAARAAAASALASPSVVATALAAAGVQTSGATTSAPVVSAGPLAPSTQPPPPTTPAAAPPPTHAAASPPPAAAATSSGGGGLSMIVVVAAAGGGGGAVALLVGAWLCWRRKGAGGASSAAAAEDAHPAPLGAAKASHSAHMRAFASRLSLRSSAAQPIGRRLLNRGDGGGSDAGAAGGGGGGGGGGAQPLPQPAPAARSLARLPSASGVASPSSASLGKLSLLAVPPAQAPWLAPPPGVEVSIAPTPKQPPLIQPQPQPQLQPGVVVAVAPSPREPPSPTDPWAALPPAPLPPPAPLAKRHFAAAAAAAVAAARMPPHLAAPAQPQQRTEERPAAVAAIVEAPPSTLNLPHTRPTTQPPQRALQHSATIATASEAPSYLRLPPLQHPQPPPPRPRALQHCETAAAAPRAQLPPSPRLGGAQQLSRRARRPAGGDGVSPPASPSDFRRTIHPQQQPSPRASLSSLVADMAHAQPQFEVPPPQPPAAAVAPVPDPAGEVAWPLPPRAAPTRRLAAGVASRRGFAVEEDHARLNT